ncbi:MAG: glycine-rich domain-containing protein [Gluconobacter cerinus]|uniref:glycine-rich domain-containing protein n=1 Tax=Gluconobacter cerinus TaxID=38307 RepID=UPI0039EBEFF7
MEQSGFPTKISVPFGKNAAAGNIRAIPVTASDDISASFSLGFPPLTMTPTDAGGTPPDGRDMNGVLFMTTAILRQYCAGAVPVFDATFQAAISGYPLNAIVADPSTVGLYWVSTADANMTVPGADEASWQAAYLTQSSLDGRYVKQYADDQTYDVTQVGINKSTGNFVAYSGGVWQSYQVAGDYATKTSISQFYPCGGSTALTVPSWATRFEYILTGGGGGGADCQASGSSITSTNASGGGGGGGSTALGIQAVTAGSSISVTIGAGGEAQASGGASSISYEGSTIATANGGAGANFSGTAVSAGGIGGSASASGGTAIPGGNGCDGQNGSFVFGGNGGGSFWGGGGRAGSKAGIAGAPFGAGGGGAYDSTFTGTFYYGGSGASGFLLYRWLP